MDKERHRPLTPEERFAKAHGVIQQILQLGDRKSESPTMVISQREDLRRLSIESGGIWNIEGISGEPESFMVRNLATAMQVYAYFSDPEFRDKYFARKPTEEYRQAIRQHLTVHRNSYQDDLLNAMEGTLSELAYGYPQRM